MTNTVVKMLYGSHLYGLDTPLSDTDYKQVVLPTKREILLQKACYNKTSSTNKGKNTKEDIDISTYSLQFFIKLCLKGDSNAIDMLHSPKPLLSTPLWDVMAANRTKLYTNKMPALLGYARNQYNRFVKKSKIIEQYDRALEFLNTHYLNTRIGRIKETPEYFEKVVWDVDHPKNNTNKPHIFYKLDGVLYNENQTVEVVKQMLKDKKVKYGDRALRAHKDGADWKSLSHALRVGCQLLDIYKYGDFEYPLKQSDLIKSIKLGYIDYQIAEATLESIMSEVEELAAKSTFPDKIDPTFWEDLIMETHASIVRSCK